MKRAIKLPVFRYENYNIDYEITQRRKNQKHIILRFKNGTLTVSAPKIATIRQIESVLGQNMNWILTRQNQTDNLSGVTQGTHAFPSEVFIFGLPYYIEVSTTPELSKKHHRPLSISQSTICIFVPKSIEKDVPLRIQFVHRVLYQYLFSLAQKAIPDCLMELAQQFGLVPTRIAVKEQRSRWGSCSVNGSIYMNWRLVQAPHAVIQYVAIHELAHLKEHNHSPRFWKIVEQMQPDYKIHRLWLKENGEQLFKIQKP